MMDIVADPEAFTKLSPAIIEQIRQKMLQSDRDWPKAKAKWQDNVTLKDGNRYAVFCKREGDKVVIIGARPALKKREE